MLSNQFLSSVLEPKNRCVFLWESRVLYDRNNTLQPIARAGVFGSKGALLPL